MNAPQFLEKWTSKFENFQRYLDVEVHEIIGKGYLTTPDGKREKLHWEKYGNKFVTNSGIQFNDTLYKVRRGKAIEKIVNRMCKEMNGRKDFLKDKNVYIQTGSGNGMDNHYRNDLGNGEYLDAYSINPEMKGDDLKDFVISKATGGTNIKRYSKDIKIIEPPEDKKLWTLEGLNFSAIDKRYKVPEELAAYRAALAINEDIKGNFNGPIGIITGKPGTDITFIGGGFYDWRGTQIA